MSTQRAFHSSCKQSDNKALGGMHGDPADRVGPPARRPGADTRSRRVKLFRNWICLKRPDLTAGGCTARLTIGNTAMRYRDRGLANCVMAAPTHVPIFNASPWPLRPDRRDIQSAIEFDTARTISIPSVSILGKSRKPAPRSFTSGSTRAPDRRLDIRHLLIDRYRSSEFTTIER